MKVQLDGPPEYTPLADDDQLNRYLPNGPKPSTGITARLLSVRRCSRHWPIAIIVFGVVVNAAWILALAWLMLSPVLDRFQ